MLETIEVKSILLRTTVGAVMGSELSIQTVLPSCPIAVIPRKRAPSPTPKRKGPPRIIGSRLVEPVLVEGGAGENIKGNPIRTGIITGTTIRRMISFLRVADLISRLKSARETWSRP